MPDTPTPGRPAPSSPPPADLADTARHAFRTAGALRGLVELLAIAEWQPDGYSRDDLAEVANVITGLSIRLALGAGDPEVLSEVTGRRYVQIREPFDPAHLAALGDEAPPPGEHTDEPDADPDAPDDRDGSSGPG